MRNTAMKDTLSKALDKKPGKLITTKPPSPLELSRREAVKKKFSPKVHTAVAADTACPVPEPSIPTPAAVAVMEPEVIEVMEPEVIEEIKEHDPTSSEVDQALTRISEAARPSLPPDLAWLEQETPFNDYLKGIVGHLRDAKSRINFTLEQSLMREKALQAAFDKAQSELLTEQLQIETLKGQLLKLDASMSGCAMLAEQSAEIAPLIYHSKQHHHPVEGKKHIRPSADDPTICRRADVLKFFVSNPGSNWSSQEVRQNMPSAKQAHARKSCTQIMAYLCNEGKIKRISEGVYRLA